MLSLEMTGKRDELVGRHLHDQRRGRKGVWRHRSAETMGRRAESAVYRTILLHVGSSCRCLLLFVVAVFMIPLSGMTKTVLNQQIMLPPMATATTEQTVFSQPFEIKGNRNVRITAGAQVDNSWADLDVDLVNDQNPGVGRIGQCAGRILQRRRRRRIVDRGRQIDRCDAFVVARPANTRCRSTGTWQNWQAQMPVSVKVEQNVNRGVNFCCAFLILLIVPVLGFFRKFTFESSRWKDSMFSSSGSASRRLDYSSDFG